MRLLWITNVPSPYRVDFFNELGKLCELTVLFEKAGATNRDGSWADYTFEGFEGIVLPGISYSPDASASSEVLKYLRRSGYDAIIITNFSSPTGALAIAYLKAARKQYYLESDGGFPGGSRLKQWVKRMVIGGAQGYFSTSEAHDEYYLTYGAEPCQLIRYPFTSVRAADVLTELPTPVQKLAAKRELGISESNMILSIGQYIPRKGYDVLLRACKSLTDDAAVCIVGGEPPREYRQLVKTLGLPTVHFVGFKQRAELRRYYAAADVFVLPTREDIWGLVVNEALANGLPVITTDRCGAGLELVAKSGCGSIVPADDAQALRSAIDTVLGDSKSRMVMGREALEVSKNYTIELMAQCHEQELSERVSRSVR